MTTKTVTLGNTPTNAHGRRYTDAERDAAYLTWKVAAKRSATKAAELTGISKNTLLAWHDQHGWAKRAAAEDHELTESVRIGLATTVSNETEKSLNTLIELRDDTTAPHKVRLDAAVMILTIAGVPTKAQAAPPKLVEPAPAIEAGYSIRQLPPPDPSRPRPTLATIGEEDWNEDTAPIARRLLAHLADASGADVAHLTDTLQSFLYTYDPPPARPDDWLDEIPW